MPSECLRTPSECLQNASETPRMPQDALACFRMPQNALMPQNASECLRRCFGIPQNASEISRDASQCRRMIRNGYFPGWGHVGIILRTLCYLRMGLCGTVRQLVPHHDDESSTTATVSQTPGPYPIAPRDEISPRGELLILICMRAYLRMNMNVVTRIPSHRLLSHQAPSGRAANTQKQSVHAKVAHVC